jgi:hypothetical protein
MKNIKANINEIAEFVNVFLLNYHLAIESAHADWL